MNDEAKNDEKKLIDRHKKFFDLERNRFIQIINELDQIIDNCDRQMEDTLHELASQAEQQNQQNTEISSNSTNKPIESQNYLGGIKDQQQKGKAAAAQLDHSYQ